MLAVLLLAEQGTRIFLHGTHEPNSNRFYLAEVLLVLGIPLAADIEQVNSHLDQHGIGYMSLTAINPQLYAVIQLHSQFGLCSCANTLARMLNPTNSDYSLQPKELDCTNLISFWCGFHSDEYGENAVLGSLTTMLVLMNDISWVGAVPMATVTW